MKYAIADTGSEHSIISSQLVERLGLENDLIPAYVELQTFGSEVIVAEYCINISITFEDQTHTTLAEFLVHEKESEVLILGQNVLRVKSIALRDGIKEENEGIYCLTNLHEQGTRKSPEPFEVPVYRRLSKKEMKKNEQHADSSLYRDFTTRYSVPYVPVHVGENLLIAMIDTGSVYSTIEHRSLKRLNSRPHIEYSDNETMTGAAITVKVIGTVELYITFRNRENEEFSIKHQFRIIENPGEPMTLGCPLFFGKGITLDMCRNQLTFENGVNLDINYLRDENVEKTINPRIKNKNRRKSMKAFYLKLVTHNTAAAHKLNQHLETSGMDEKAVYLMDVLEKMQEEQEKFFRYLKNPDKFDNQTVKPMYISNSADRENIQYKLAVSTKTATRKIKPPMRLIETIGRSDTETLTNPQQADTDSKLTSSHGNETETTVETTHNTPSIELPKRGRGRPKKITPSTQNLLETPTRNLLEAPNQTLNITPPHEKSTAVLEQSERSETPSPSEEDSDYENTYRRNEDSARITTDNIIHIPIAEDTMDMNSNPTTEKAPVTRKKLKDSRIPDNDGPSIKEKRGRGRPAHSYDKEPSKNKMATRHPETQKRKRNIIPREVELPPSFRTLEETTITHEITKKLQKEDPLCIQLTEIALDRPVSSKIYKKHTNYLQALKENLHINENGILIYRNHIRSRDLVGEPPEDRVVLPLAMSKLVIKNYHADLCHPGMQKTTQIISQRYWRPTIRGIPSIDTIVRVYVKDCFCCLKKNTARLPPHAPLKIPAPPSEPWHIVSMDYVGPFKEAIGGQKYIIVFQDAFSRYVIAEAVRHQTMNNAIEVFMRRVVAEYGTPQFLLSDNGTQFTGDDFRNLCKRMGIQKTYTLPYSAWANGRNERSHAVIIASLKQLVSDYGADNWAMYLAMVVMIYNNTFSASIGDTPSFLARGVDVILPPDILKSEYQRASEYIDAEGKEITTYGTQLFLKNLKIKKVYGDMMTAEQLKQHTEKNKKRRLREMKPGQLALIRLPLKVGESKKMYSELAGPFRIILINHYKITFRTQGGRKLYNAHINNVYPLTENFQPQYEHWSAKEKELLELDNTNTEDNIDDEEDDTQDIAQGEEYSDPYLTLEHSREILESEADIAEELEEVSQIEEAADTEELQDEGTFTDEEEEISRNQLNRHEINHPHSPPEKRMRQDQTMPQTLELPFIPTPTAESGAIPKRKKANSETEKSADYLEKSETPFTDYYDDEPSQEPTNDYLSESINQNCPTDAYDLEEFISHL